MRRVILSLWLGTIFFLATHGAYACVCDPEVAPRQALNEATAVFVARVTFMEVIYKKIGENDQKMSFLPEVQVVFEVEHLWKGINNKVFIVRTSAGDCGYKFVFGERYLVYAYGKDLLMTSGCTRTKPLVKATEDLKELGKPKKKPKT